LFGEVCSNFYTTKMNNGVDFIFQCSACHVTTSYYRWTNTEQSSCRRDQCCNGGRESLLLFRGDSNDNTVLIKYIYTKTINYFLLKEH
jgi:hypothetical protein